jgi:hypothetical protein
LESYLTWKEVLPAPEVGKVYPPEGSPTSVRVLKNISPGKEVLPAQEFGKVHISPGRIPTSARVWKSISPDRDSYVLAPKFGKYLTWKECLTSD